MAKMYSVTVRSRAAGLALAAGVIGVGIVLVTIGLALLAGLALAAGVFGAGYGIYHRLRGGRAVPRATGYPLDPSLEVRPVESPVIRSLPGEESSRGESSGRPRAE